MLIYSIHCSTDNQLGKCRKVEKTKLKTHVLYKIKKCAPNNLAGCLELILFKSYVMFLKNLFSVGLYNSNKNIEFHLQNQMVSLALMNFYLHCKIINVCMLNTI